MALTKCKECGAQVSTTAKACPQCGAKPPARTSGVAWGLGAVLAMFFVIGIAANMRARDAPPPPPKTAAQEKADREINVVIAGARLLKQAMKKPEAFELVSATMIGDDTICYVYKGRNSFNDQAMEHYVVSNTVSSGTAKDWNRFCAGKSGTDYSYASASL